MDPGPLRDVLTAAAGLVTGALSGAFGVGGAVVSTPAIRLLGVPAIVAVGTTLPSILPSAISGTLRYRSEDLIDWRAVAWTVPVGLVAAVVGALASEVVPGEGHVLMIATALLLAVTAWRMGVSPAEKPAATPEGEDIAGGGSETPAHGRRSPATLSGIGAVAGLLSGLLGIGGGTIMVPGFHQLAGLPIKPAIATSLVCVGAFAIPGTVTHAALGNIDWRVALFLTLTVVPGARLGAAATIGATDRRVRHAVAGFLGIIALAYAAGEIAALA